MGIAHGGVADEKAFLLSNPFTEPIRSLRPEDVARPDRRALPVINLRNLCLHELRRPEWSGDPRRAVDDDIADEGEDLVRPVLLLPHLKQLRVFVDEGGVALAGKKYRMGDDVFEETDVRLHATDAELQQAALHDVGSRGKSEPPTRDLDQERVVVGGDVRAGIGIPRVKTDAETCG